MQKPKFNQGHIIQEIVRVNHAGEYGAKMIYQGQIDNINSKKDREKINEMYEQELVHLKYFENQLLVRRVRPTILMPIWHLGGYLLGRITAKLGAKQAMICTDAVEEVIGQHYEEQKLFLKKNISEKDLYNSITQFQAEEFQHQDIAQNAIGNINLKDRILYGIINFICKIAILCSKKI